MLQDYLVNAGFNVNEIEGYSQQVPKQVERLKMLISGNNIKNVMEIGFNAGHSSEIMLETNKNINLVSFDINIHKYTKVGKEYIDKTYVNRHTLIIGDSMISVPEYIKSNSHKKFDLIFIDGGHDYKVAKADVENCRQLAHKDTIVIVDDVVYTIGSKRAWTIGPSNVWKEYVAGNLISEIAKEEYMQGRGMAWGKYIL